jgi:protein O-GlcNAc transferase
MASGAQPQADTLARVHQLLDTQQPAAAEVLLRRHLVRNPNDARANFLLAAALYYQGKHAQCEFFARKAQQLAPEVAKHANLLGQVCMKLGKSEEALLYCRRATELDPKDATSWNALGAMFMLQERAEDAYGPLTKSYELDRNDMTAACNLAGCLADTAQTERACALLEEALSRFPHDPATLITYAGLVSYPESITPEAKAMHASRLGAFLDRLAGGQVLSRVTSFSPDRPLRVGLLSADFRSHSCGFFLMPLLRHLEKESSEAGGLHLHVFDSTAFPDTTTSPRMRALCERWTRVASLRDEEVAREIAKQEIDVLIELGGHTSNSRVGCAAWRPAPVCATYMGYPSTTGMRTMDFRIVDAITDPEGSERWHSERLLRLPGCFLCYEPSPELLAVESDLARTSRPPDAPMVFGSFNAIKKVGHGAIRRWSAVLKALPGSTLVLKGHASPGSLGDRELRGAFAREGVDPARLTIHPRASAQTDHLRLYNTIDIALDTYPYNGTTTTCEALLMGVPVLTLEGPWHVSRVSSSLLAAVGLPELIARSDEELLTKAVSLASDRARLRDYHATLRARLLASALCEGQAFARTFAHGVRTMWRTRGAPHATTRAASQP